MENLQEKFSKIKKFDLTGYRSVKNMGCGNYGSIFLINKENDYAIIKNFLKTEELDDIDELIEREIKNLSKCTKFEQLIIGFRGISFKDLDQNPIKFPLLILNYASNGSLKDLLENSNNKLSISTKMIFLYGVAKAMEFLHFNKIAHRDLKPGNILLDENNYPLLTDFGSSRTYNLKNAVEATSFTGTLLYDAPEVLNETIIEKNVPKVDVFSYGMLVYEILTGKKPYDGYLKNTNLFTITKFLEKKRFSIPDSIPSYFKQLISILWQQDPIERPTFSDVVQFFECGILLPEIHQNKEHHDKFFEYINHLDLDTNSFEINKKNLIDTQNSLINKSPKLSVAVTMFLADFCDDSEAQLMIGRYYSDGTFVDINRDLGFEYLNKAAAKNNPKAYFYLGLAHLYGIGCKDNNLYKSFGMELIEKSSEMGFETATSFLNEEKEYENIDKVNAPLAIIIGSITTGKTTFLNKLLDFHNNSLPSPTIGVNDLLLRCKNENGDKFFIRLRDTMGMEKHNSLVQSYKRNAKLVLIMFDLNDRKTYEDIDEWIQILHKDEAGDVFNEINHIIIGNKIDKERFVSLAEASEKAKKYNADYFEVSALTGQNIQYPLAKIIEYLKPFASININCQNLVDIADESHKEKKKCCS